MLQVQNVTLTLKKDLRELIHDFSFTLAQKARTAIIGEEGDGKSTLLKWLYDPKLVEDYCEESGQRIHTHETLGYLPQMLTKEDSLLSVYEFMCESSSFSFASVDEVNQIAYDLQIPVDLFYQSEKMSQLSGGEKIKVQIARLMFDHPTIYLFDEPTNDLDADSLDWMTSFMNHSHASFLYISHDEKFLRDTSKQIIHLELLNRKTKSSITYLPLPYEEYIQNRRDRIERENQIASNQRKEEKKQEEKFQKVEQSVQHALRSVSRQDPYTAARLKSKMHTVKAMGKRMEKEKEGHMQVHQVEESINMFFDPIDALLDGKLVLDYHLDQLMKPDQSDILAKPIDLKVYAPHHVGITGKNGCGKSTLLKAIYQYMKDHSSLKVGYMPQNYEDAFDLSKTVLDFLGDGTKERMTRAASLLGSMRYTSDEMSHSLADLSGGQQAKVLFLKLNLEQDQVLLLDEPTRNFSPLSAPVIRNMLKDYNGVIISVSHNRQYLEDVCDQVYELDRDGLHLL